MNGSILCAEGLHESATSTHTEHRLETGSCKSVRGHP